MNQIQQPKQLLLLIDVGFYKIENAFGEIFQVMEFTSGVITAPLAFPLIIRPEAPLSRRSLQEALESNGVQTRTCFTGNITRQPACRAHGIPPQSFAVSDHVMKSGILLGCHQRMTLETVDALFDVFQLTVNKLLGR